MKLFDGGLVTVTLLILGKSIGTVVVVMVDVDLLYFLLWGQVVILALISYQRFLFKRLNG